MRARGAMTRTIRHTATDAIACIATSISAGSAQFSGASHVATPASRNAA